MSLSAAIGVPCQRTVPLVARAHGSLRAGPPWGSPMITRLRNFADWDVIERRVWGRQNKIATVSSLGVARLGAGLSECGRWHGEGADLKTKRSPSSAVGYSASP
ncbi:hypothetical protein NDU88_007733 [Pleurodeles waltl]|uniref:Uncharacterized protein n=1 Tax=Pleurodeles waltl TaxID=8319 RepID=A0AAV7U0J0_PLEWA|nr:hypothetical protein NDU88_007733 [Pleurodeles waltl]